MLPNVGMGELLLILLVILLLFGTKRLPEVAKGLGRSIKSFKEGIKEGLDEPANSTETSKSNGTQDKKSFPA